MIDIAEREQRLDGLYVIAPEEGGGIIPFVRRPEQQEFSRNAHGRDLIIKTRKLGFSTEIEIEHLDACITRPQTHCAIVDRTGSDAEKKLDIARLAWVESDKHPDRGIRMAWQVIKEEVQLVNANQSEMVFSNGSRIEAGVSFRGGTPQRLHVSEFGPVAAEDDKRAREIVQGAIAAVPPSGSIVIETTYKGGKRGECYRIAQMALEAQGKALSPLDWRFWFFPWWRHPSYATIGNYSLSDESRNYFERVKESHGLEFSREQMQWWDRTRRLQGLAMGQEYPTTPEEVFQSAVEGAIYAREIDALRIRGRITSFDWERSEPVHTFWDLGAPDNTFVWYVQFVGREVHLIDCDAGYEGTLVEHVASMRSRGYPFGSHYLPHDAMQTERSGRTMFAELQAAGLTNCKVVPRTVDVWVPINDFKEMLPRCWFRLPHVQPGLESLEYYHKRAQTATGLVVDEPVHDFASHAADAARLIAETQAAGMLEGQSSTAIASRRRLVKPMVRMGLRG